MPRVSAPISASARRPPDRVDPAAIARTLAPATRWPGSLAEVSERSWRLLAATDQFDAWVIAWPQDGRVSLHDHGPSRGAFAVVHGTLDETMPWRDDTGRLTLRRLELSVGSLRSLGVGHIHDVTNPGPETAVSLHVYSPPLASMTHYDIAGGERLQARVVRTARHWKAAAPGASDAERPVLCPAG